LRRFFIAERKFYDTTYQRGGAFAHPAMGRQTPDSLSGLWAKGDFVSSNYVEPEQKKESLLKPEIIASAGGLISGLGGMASGAGPIQWALAIIMVGAFVTGAYFLIKRMQDQAA